MANPDLILDPLATPGVLAAKLWIRRGSASDPEGQRGAHQLLGSLLSRGCGPYGPVELADLVEGCGAGLRCDTNEDGLLISLKCRDSDASRLLPVIGWMLHQPHLRPDQVNLEKELSLQALQRQKEDPFHLAYDGWRSLVYGHGGYGHDPLGVPEELEDLDQSQLSALARQLDAKGTVLALSGTIPDQLLSLLDHHDSFQPSSTIGGTTVQRAEPCGPRETASADTLCLRPQNTEQVVLMMGQAALSHGDPNDPALRLLQAHLGNGMSSLLFRRLREEHGVAYDVGVHHPARDHASPFVFHASTSLEKGSRTLQLLLDCWWEMRERPLSPEDLALARIKVRGQLAHASQTTGQRAERRAQLRGLGLPDDHDARCLEAMDRLDAGTIQAIAREHLSQPRLSLCGPEPALKTLEKIWQKEVCPQR